jgi:hypothetical protein
MRARVLEEQTPGTRGLRCARLTQVIQDRRDAALLEEAARPWHSILCQAAEG